MNTAHLPILLRAVFVACSIFSTSNLLADDTPGGSGVQTDSQLNILLFTADDLHSESVGVFSGKPKDLTPNLDQFARESMQFHRAHVNVAICAPSRAVIATGLYSHRSGAVGFVKARAGTPDVVSLFQEAGYLAGILGKVSHSTPVPGTAWDFSYDRSDLGNGRNPRDYHERCREFFRLAKKTKKPFYFMVNSHDPHRPYCDPQRLLAGAAPPSKTYQPDEVSVPGFLPDLPGVRRELAHYLNSTRRLDDTFGRVIEALREAGLEQNTLVLFLSDNGIATPFAKCNVWLHSSRTPLLVRWPGVVQPGSVNHESFVSGVDFLPTFLEATGVSGPANLDGRSFVPLLQGKPQTGRDHVFTQIDMKSGGAAVPMRSVQDARYGYIYNPFCDGKTRYRNNNEGKTMRAMQRAASTHPEIAQRIQMFRYRVPEEFYDLKQDPNCLRNLIDSPDQQETIAKMRKKLEEGMRKTNDPLLPAMQNRENRQIVDQAISQAYAEHRRGRAKKRRE